MTEGAELANGLADPSAGWPHAWRSAYGHNSGDSGGPDRFHRFRLAA